MSSFSPVLLDPLPGEGSDDLLEHGGVRVVPPGGGVPLELDPGRILAVALVQRHHLKRVRQRDHVQKLQHDEACSVTLVSVRKCAGEQ